MKISDKFKSFLHNILTKELSGIEIIPHDDAIWFIDREKKYWYLEYHKTGGLYWRWKPFNEIFSRLSIEEKDFVPIISEWVEKTLSCNVKNTFNDRMLKASVMEQVSIAKKYSMEEWNEMDLMIAEDVLKHQVKITERSKANFILKVENILNSK